MDEVTAEKPKRRRKSRSARKSGTWGDYFRGPEFGRHLFIGMCLLGVGYVGLIAYKTRMASVYYSSVVVDLPEPEVRYVFGAPQATEANGRVYRYASGNRLITITLSDDNLLTSVSCTAERRNAARCERILGVGIGDTEADLVIKLGAPTRVTYPGNDKVMHYDGMGLTFYLRKYQIYAMELHKGGSLMGYLPRALWQMIP